jgi:hypothetical protein
VNVKDKAALIAGYHRRFYDALDAAGWMPSEARPATPAAATQGATLAGLLARLLALIFGKGK